MINITEQDIEFSEELLLPNGKKFDDERRRVIKILETMDIHECPGSGKTTVLLAKLIILSRYMPLPCNRGICVLTHTNVAVNEIESRVGLKAQSLLKYPNFFGTMQAFVDKYLAIPFYIENFGKRPHRIDNDVYYERVEQTYKSLGWGARSYIERKREYMEWLKNLRFDLEHCYLTEGLMGVKAFSNDKCNTAQQIGSFKQEIMRQGYLCFDDAYYLAYQYVKKYGDILKNAFSQRFAYVFIDEMQDTDSHQLTLLNKLFDPAKITAIQKIGDPNQAIYNHYSFKDKPVWEFPEGSLCILGSKRFSNSIAKIVSNLSCIPQTISGNSDIPEIKPKLIVFDDTSVDRVLDTFGDLIMQNELYKNNNPVFKAIGWIGKEHEKRTLISYWNGYRGTINNKKTEYYCLQDYLQMRNKSHGVNYYRKNVLNAMVKILRLLGKKESEHIYFSLTTMLNYLSNNHKDCFDKLQLKLVDWCTRAHKGNSIFADVRTFIKTDFMLAFNLQRLDPIEEFLNLDNGAFDAQNQEVQLASPGIYKYTKSGTSVDIEVTTVHSVKGETHTATLYLETFYKKYDIKRILNYLHNGERLKNVGSDELRALRIAYVGMSRPSHLLCVAAHKDSVEGHVSDLNAFGWDIIDISPSN